MYDAFYLIIDIELDLWIYFLCVVVVVVVSWESSCLCLICIKYVIYGYFWIPIFVCVALKNLNRDEWYLTEKMVRVCQIMYSFHEVKNFVCIDLFYTNVPLSSDIRNECSRDADIYCSAWLKLYYIEKC